MIDQRITIDVYPVGALANARRAWRFLTLPAARFPSALDPPVTWRWRIDRAYSQVYGTYRSVRRHVRNRQWRDLKNTFNGHLAEPTPWPDGIGLTRCGSGWTRTGAILSLYRHASKHQPLTVAHPELFAAILAALKEGRP